MATRTRSRSRRRAATAYGTNTEPSESSNADLPPLPSDPRPASRAQTEPGRRVIPEPARPLAHKGTTDTYRGPSRTGGLGIASTRPAPRDESRLRHSLHRSAPAAGDRVAARLQPDLPLAPHRARPIIQCPLILGRGGGARIGGSGAAPSASACRWRARWPTRRKSQGAILRRPVSERGWRRWA